MTHYEQPMPLLTRVVLLCLVPFVAVALERLDGVQLVESPSNDGDSFMVSHEGNQLLIRLYWVDAPETSAGSSTDARRVVEQARYFGIENPKTVIAAGKQATEFTRRLLEQPFTVYTAYAHAPGRSSTPRIYAFVVLDDGRDLGEVMVQSGYARVGSIRRTSYRADESFNELDARYQDLQTAAQLGRRGLWAECNPDLLPLLRQLQRNEEKALQELIGNAPPKEKLSINTASAEQLQTIPGIGETMAQRLIDNRPYPNLEALKSVKGIGDTRWTEWQNYLTE